MKRPEIGTKMFTVWEHLYYAPGVAGPLKEYVVCEGEVTGFFEGSWVDIDLKGKDPDGFMTPYRRRLKDIGTDVFYTAKEAAELARRTTEDFERSWAWIGPPEIPMRRLWTHYLEEDGGANK